MKKRKKKKTVMFVQSLEVYPDEILVLCGIDDKKKVFSYLNKINAKADFTKWVLEHFDEWKEDIKKDKGMFAWEEGVSGHVLILREFYDVWEYWETLLHELNHVVFHVAKRRGFADETENQAYLQEFLFRQMRRKLQGVDNSLA